MSAATMVTPSDFTAFPWMEYAFKELGTTEQLFPGRNNPRILAYHWTSCGASDDELSWCSSFANWSVTQAGIKGTYNPMARSWLRWGDTLPVTKPAFGCITILSRPPNARSGHVGFLVGTSAGKISLLGGNQQLPGKPGAVCIKDYPQHRWLGYRWPKGLPPPR